MDAMMQEALVYITLKRVTTETSLEKILLPSRQKCLVLLLS